MMWIFDYWNQINLDPFNNQLLSINATEVRNDSYKYANYYPNRLIEWNNSYGYYSQNIINASIEFFFIKQPILLRGYKLLSLIGACSPFGIAVEGSFDGVEYFTLDYIASLICIDSTCSQKKEPKQMIKNNKQYFRYIKLVQTIGECNGLNQYFGLNSVDFYVSYGYNICTCVVTKDIFTDKLKFIILIMIK